MRARQAGMLWVYGVGVAPPTASRHKCLPCTNQRVGKAVLKRNAGCCLSWVEAPGHRHKAGKKRSVRVYGCLSLRLLTTATEWLPFPLSKLQAGTCACMLRGR